MIARNPGQCWVCGQPINPGDEITLRPARMGKTGGAPKHKACKAPRPKRYDDGDNDPLYTQRKGTPNE